MRDWPPGAPALTHPAGRPDSAAASADAADARTHDCLVPALSDSDTQTRWLARRALTVGGDGVDGIAGALPEPVGRVRSDGLVAKSPAQLGTLTATYDAARALTASAQQEHTPYWLKRRLTRMGSDGALEPSDRLLLAMTCHRLALAPADRDLLRRRSIGIVLQDLGLLPFLNAWENVAAAFGPRLARHRTEARALLGDLGMEDLADSRVTELSGGQRQRIAVARAAVKQPVLILADEPTSGLDPKTANSVMDALRSCAERGAAVLLVTHDTAVAETCDRRHVLDGGVLSTGDLRNAREGSLG